MAIEESKVEAIFFAALEKQSPEDCVAYLDDVCATDPSLRQRVEALLNARPKLGNFLQGHAADMVATTSAPPTSERPGTQIGPYKLLQQIGEGGMGTVYMADQEQPVRRKVALKVIKPGMDSGQVIARFEAERQALAMMDHVNIARVLDAGTTSGEPGGVSPGRPFFVMELVNGVSITKYCDDNRLTPRQRLELFVPVCQAIQHAHQKGIIHRDIKPSNVMVTLYDGKPVPKVIDFGVAKATEQKLTERTLFTQYGTMIGTLEYMSPEQAEMSALGVDTRSDIYSLGVLLYELLTGSTPLSRKRIKEAAFAEILRLIKDEEPPRPSTRISESGEALASISAMRHMEPGKLSKLMRGELDWIVMKTLEKDRNRRYETANGFAADVQRYLNDEPVQACPPSAGYRLRKFARRNRVAITAVALVSVALVLGTVVSTWQAISATRARHDAEAARTEEATQRAVADRRRIEADEQRAEADQQRRQAVDARKEAVANLQKAREAVDRMLTRVAEEQIAHVPQMEQLRRKLLLDAIQFYQALLQENNADPELRAETAHAYNRVGNIHVNLGELPEAEEAYGKAIILFNKLIAEVPSQPSYQFGLSLSHVRLGQVFWKAGRSEEAVKSDRQALAVRQKLLAEFPGEPTHEFWVAHTHTHLGGRLQNYGRLQEAEEEFRQALKITEKLAAESPTPDPYRYDLALVHADLAWVLTVTGRAEEAEEEFGKSLAEYKQLVQLHPNDPLANEGLALLLATCPFPKFRDVGEAVKLAKKAVELEPQETKYWRALGIAQYSAGDWKAAVAALEESTKWGGWINSDWILLAKAYSQLGDTEAAETAYRKLLKQAPNSAVAHNNLAWLLATCPEPKIRDAGRAVELAKKAVELAPKEGSYWNTLGIAHYRAGEWKAAVAALEKSMQLLFGKEESFNTFFLAMAHSQLGEKEGARKRYDQAVEWMEKNKPNDEELKRFRDEAAELLKIDKQPTTQSE